MREFRTNVAVAEAEPIRIYADQQQPLAVSGASAAMSQLSENVWLLDPRLTNRMPRPHRLVSSRDTSASSAVNSRTADPPRKTTSSSPVGTKALPDGLEHQRIVVAGFRGLPACCIQVPGVSEFEPNDQDGGDGQHRQITRGPRGRLDEEPRQPADPGLKGAKNRHSGKRPKKFPAAPIPSRETRARTRRGLPLRPPPRSPAACARPSGYSSDQFGLA